MARKQSRYAMKRRAGKVPHRYDGHLRGVFPPVSDHEAHFFQREVVLRVQSEYKLTRLPPLDRKVHVPNGAKV